VTDYRNENNGCEYGQLGGDCSLVAQYAEVGGNEEWKNGQQNALYQQNNHLLKGVEQVDNFLAFDPSGRQAHKD